MDQFREGHINILVATDLAARGIDVKEISYVVNYHLPDAYESTCTVKNSKSRSKGNFLTVLQEEEVQEIAEKKNWESNSQNLKPSALSIEENNTLLWAKQIFKTKPNHEDAELKTKIKTVFHHLTKDELIENCWLIICCKTKRTSKKP
jgi:ATP-dependent RNA helicase DeaD